MACFPLNFLSEEITTYALSLAEHSLGVFSHQSAWSNRLLRTLYYKDTNCRNNHFSLFPVKKNGIGPLPSLKNIVAMRLKRKLSEPTFALSLVS